MAVLDRLNREMNGPQPSEALTGEDDVVPREVAYAIVEVARMLRDADRVVEAWAVDTAWAAILAGDIDDLAEHVEAEHAARSGPRPRDAPTPSV